MADDDDNKSDPQHGSSRKIEFTTAKQVRQGAIYYDKDGNVVKISRHLPQSKRGGCNGNCPYNELVLVVLFLLVLYGFMAAFFIALIVANANCPTFAVLWAFFGIFCAFVVGLVIICVRQYQRSRKELKDRKRFLDNDKIDNDKNLEDGLGSDIEETKRDDDDISIIPDI